MYVEQLDEYKQKIYTATVAIDGAVSTASSASSATGPVSITCTSSHDDLLPTHEVSRVKLPKLTIRPFDGDITKWTGF